jgi:hypothetical protein
MIEKDALSMTFMDIHVKPPNTTRESRTSEMREAGIETYHEPQGRQQKKHQRNTCQ